MTNTEANPQNSPVCPNGDHCDPDIECPVCDRDQIAFWSGAAPGMFILRGLAYLAEPETTDIHLSTALEQRLDELAETSEHAPTEDLRQLTRGLIHAIRMHIPTPPHLDTDPHADDETRPPPTACSRPARSRRTTVNRRCRAQGTPETPND